MSAGEYVIAVGVWNHALACIFLHFDDIQHDLLIFILGYDTIITITQGVEIKMRKKEVFSSKEIKKDIIHAILWPAKQRQGVYIITLASCVVIGILLGVVSWFVPQMDVWFGVSLALVVVLLPVTLILRRVLLKKRLQKTLSFDDYCVNTEKVRDTAEETYITGGLRLPRMREVSNYTITFENGKSWRVSENNYSWSKEYPMKALGVYHTAHKGDLMYVVTKRSDGKIVMAYHTDYFEYKQDA